MDVKRALCAKCQHKFRQFFSKMVTSLLAKLELLEHDNNKIKFVIVHCLLLKIKCYFFRKMQDLLDQNLLKLLISLQRQAPIIKRLAHRA